LRRVDASDRRRVARQQVHGGHRRGAGLGTDGTDRWATTTPPTLLPRAAAGLVAMRGAPGRGGACKSLRNSSKAAGFNSARPLACSRKQRRSMHALLAATPACLPVPARPHLLIAGCASMHACRPAGASPRPPSVTCNHAPALCMCECFASQGCDPSLHAPQIWWWL
jgi:hypothetical protein